MNCPRCGTDNPEDADVCAKCGASLVDESEGDEIEFVPILVTNDAASLAVAQSLLEAEGIECEIQGESGQETLGLGPLPGVTGPVRLMVAPEDEEDARALLAQQNATTGGDE
jgi:hypothetical protein